MIVLLGGTFNPPHQGHILAGLAAAEELGAESLGLLPCKVPPHKAAPETTTEHRLAMLALTCEQDARLYVEPIELSLPSPSYSLKTLAHLRQENPSESLCFLLGEDSLYNLPTWYDWQRLTDYCHIVVMKRPAAKGSITEELQDWLTTRVSQSVKQLRDQRAGRVFFAETQDYSVSSTQLRQALTADHNNGQPILQNWLSPAVLNYIKQHQLYGITCDVSEENFCNTSNSKTLL